MSEWSNCSHTNSIIRAVIYVLFSNSLIILIKTKEIFNQCFETGRKLSSKQVGDLKFPGVSGLIKYSFSNY
jgi:hypothetical protein